MKKREHLGRYIALAGIFLLVCLIYIGRLVNLQIAGQDYYTMTSGSKTSTRTVTIQALRGQIYDRNGVALVTNKYSYDVSFEATTLPAKNADKNPLIMSVIARVRDFGAEYDTPEGPFTLERNGEKFVFSWNTSYLYKDDGSYTVYASRLMRLLDDLGAKFPKNPQTQTENEEENTPDRDIPLPEADDCAALLLKRYGLTYTEKKKTYYTYNAEETRELFCFRLDMELRNFAPLNPYLIAEDAPLELITLLSEGSSRGISVKTNVERVYGVPGYASHILGRVGKIQPDKTEYYDSLGYSLDAIVGVSGVEKAFEDQLRGIDGQLTVIEDSEGNVIDEYVSKEPIAGNDVYLTIDIEYQKIVEDSLDANIAYIRALAEDKEGELDGEDARAGAFTVMNIKTGAVLAVASNPTFDLSTFDEDYASLSKNSSSPLFNRALNGAYTPGSVFKPGVAVAALNEGIITPYTEIMDEGVYRYYEETGFAPRCWINLMFGSSHGLLNVTEAIQVSCNCFFYEVGRRLGIEKMNEYCKGYGLGEHTGIELDEAVGTLGGPEYRIEHGLNAWSPGDTVQAAIGQMDNTFTPLQLSCYIATLVNGGTRYGAHILQDVRSHATGAIIYKVQTETLNKMMLSDEAVSVVLNAMKNVTEDTGSAARLFTGYPLAVGGKTGTAQVSENKSANAVFTAFAPFDDPEIVGTTVIEQGAGGTDAGYAVRDVFTHYFNLDFKDAYDEFRDRYLEERGAITNSPNAKDPKAEENANGTAGENDEKG